MVRMQHSNDSWYSDHMRDNYLRCIFNPNIIVDHYHLMLPLAEVFTPILPTQGEDPFFACFFYIDGWIGRYCPIYSGKAQGPCLPWWGRFKPLLKPMPRAEALDYPAYIIFYLLLFSLPQTHLLLFCHPFYLLLTVDRQLLTVPVPAELDLAGCHILLVQFFVQ